jgi:hypothetical protein
MDGRRRRRVLAALGVLVVVGGAGAVAGLGAVGAHSISTDTAPDCSTVGYTTNASGWYEVTNVSQLQCIENQGLDQDYVLTRDIDANGTENWNGGDGFEPVGDSSSDFAGTFDGGGYAISNLSINRSSQEYVGLFAEIGSDSLITDVHLSGLNITGSRLVGGVVGNSFGTVTQVSVNGTVEIPGSDRHVGGIVGWNYGRVADSTASVDVAGELNVGGAVGRSGGNVTNVSASGTASGQDRIGGLVGLNQGNVTNSSASGTVSGDPNVGGLVGINDGNVVRSYATGDASGSSRVGGLVGRDNGDVTDSYATGNVTGFYESTGGLVGWNYQGEITTSYATGVVVADLGGGGLVGENGGTVTDSYWDTVATNQSDGIGTDDGGTTSNLAGRTGTEMTGINATVRMDALDFASTWRPGDGDDQYPDLAWDSDFSGNADAFDSLVVGDGDGTPYRIEHVYDLQSMRYNLSANYTLANDINASSTDEWYNVSGDPKGFDPIGGSGGVFTGTFDGDGHTISDLYIDRGSNYVGLFGAVGGGKVENVGVENVDINGSTYVGGLVGGNNAAVTESYATGDVDGSNFVGGLVGENLDDVTESYATGDVNGTRNVGGLVGENEGDVTESYATGDVKGDDDYAGGLVGLNYGNVTKSYATGDVDGDVVGGLVGFNDVDSGSNGYVANSYATGDINGSSNDVGGLVGFNPDGTVEDAYWDKGTTNQSDAIGASNSGTKSNLVGFGEASDTDSAPEMQGINATVEMHRLDFSAAWRPGNGDDQYPDLAWDSAFSGSADAFDSLVTGDGDTTPYQIITVYELQSARYNLSANYTLANDIDASGTDGWYDGKGFDPVGNDSTGFGGIFDGDGHTISNLTIDRGSTDYVGLFGSIDSGSSVVAVGLANATITANGQVGALAGRNDGTVGRSFASGDLDASGAQSGGLVGLNHGDVLDTHASVNVTASSNYVGGLVGDQQSGTVTRSYAVGTVDGNSNVGGLVGYQGGGIVTDAYWDIQRTGQETSDGDAIGIFTRDMVGANALDSANMSALSVPPWETVTASTPGSDGDDYPILQDFDAEPQIRTPDTSVSGAIFIDILDGGTIVLDYVASDTVLSVKERLEARTGLAADRQDLVFAGKVLDDGRTLSDYNIQKGSTLAQASLYAGGDGKEESPYEIATWTHLDNVRETLDANFTLTNDLNETTAGYDAVASETANSGAGFEPIGNFDVNADVEFVGTFDGDDHTIADLVIDRESEDRVGLFGVLDGPDSTIRNVALTNVSVTGHELVGGLVGNTWQGDGVHSVSVNGTVEGAHHVGGVVGFGRAAGGVSEASAEGTVLTTNGEESIGGLVGGMNSGGVTDSTANVTVDAADADRVGGLVGEIYLINSGIQGSSATGDVHGNNDVGGLAGYNTEPLSDSYATGNVTGDGAHIGGLVGRNEGTISRTYATGTVSGGSDVGGIVGNNSGSVTESFAVGEVSGTSKLGGLVGNNSGTVTDGYWDVGTTGQSSSAGSPDANGLSTSEMKGQAATQNMPGLDFATTWTVADSGAELSYPYLQTPAQSPPPGLFTAPILSTFQVSNPSEQTVQVAFESSKQLTTISVAIVGPESTTLTQSDFTETATGDGYTYEATYSGSSDGEYTATLDTATDATGYDAAAGQSDSVVVDTKTPSVSLFSASNPSERDIAVTFQSNESLSLINVGLDGPETVILAGTFDVNVVDGTYIYFTTYTVSSDGEYTATLQTARDIGGNDGASGQSDTVTVDATDPTFDPEIVDTNLPVVEGERLNLTLQVTNTGNEVDTQTVTATVGDQSEDWEIVLDPGQQTTRAFTWQTGSGDAGNYTAEVSTPSASAQTGVRVDPAALTSLSLALGADTLVVGDTTDATVTAAYSDGSTAAVSDDATLAVGNTTVATVDNGTLTAQTVGETDVTASYDGAQATNTLTVTEPAVPPTLESAVVEDDQPQTVLLTFDRDVELTASEPTTGFSVPGDGADITVDGGSADGTTVELVLSEQVGPADDLTVAYDGSDNLQSVAGATADSFEQPVTNNVTGPQPGEIGVLAYELSATSALVDHDTITIEATVGNGLDEQAMTTVPLVINGSVVEEEAVTLGAGESTPVTFERTFSETGPVTVTVGDQDATTVDVFALTIGDGAGDDEGDSAPAQDLDGDGLREDVNGDGEFTLGDAQLLFEARDDPLVTEYGHLFDFDGDEAGVTLSDIQALFETLQQP